MRNFPALLAHIYKEDKHCTSLIQLLSYITHDNLRKLQWIASYLSLKYRLINQSAYLWETTSFILRLGDNLLLMSGKLCYVILISSRISGGLIDCLNLLLQINEYLPATLLNQLRNYLEMASYF